MHLNGIWSPFIFHLTYRPTVYFWIIIRAILQANVIQCRLQLFSNFNDIFTWQQLHTGFGLVAAAVLKTTV